MAVAEEIGAHVCTCQGAPKLCLPIISDNPHLAAAADVAYRCVPNYVSQEPESFVNTLSERAVFSLGSSPLLSWTEQSQMEFIGHMGTTGGTELLMLSSREWQPFIN